jgi:HEPN domain-containing protein
MQPPDADVEARAWLVRAQRDLQAAESLMAATAALPDIAVYHAQQAAEKSLKAVLARHEQPVRKTHDLVALLADVLTVEPAFDQFLEAVQTLSPYGTRFRYPYPGAPLAPSIEEATTAIELATNLVEFVRACLRED